MQLGYWTLCFSLRHRPRLAVLSAVPRTFWQMAGGAGVSVAGACHLHLPIRDDLQAGCDFGTAYHLKLGST